MQYKYVKEQAEYSDYASGRVFYSLPGHPAFPVRLGSEIFQRCLAKREAIYGASTPCTLYDPCCGAAYHLSVLGYLHRERIREIIASDIDETAVEFARRNLGLLHQDGLQARIRELSEVFERYGKDSHREALRSAAVLKEKLSADGERYPLGTRAFQASATNRAEMVKHIDPGSVDIILSDVPYGRHSRWNDSHVDEMSNPLTSILEALLGVLSRTSSVAIVSDKGQKAAHERFERIQQFQLGKRRVAILRPL